MEAIGGEIWPALRGVDPVDHRKMVRKGFDLERLINKAKQQCNEYEQEKALLRQKIEIQKDREARRRGWKC